MKNKVVKKTELTAFAKECVKGATWMLNGICMAEDIVKTQLCRSILNGTAEEKDLFKKHIITYVVNRNRAMQKAMS